jgi:two-component system, LytTR family, sensor kinase
MSLHNNTKYWLCQFTGWGTFVALSIINSRAREADDASTTVIADVLFGILALTVTHLSRIYIYKRLWHRLPTEQLVPRVLISIAVQAILLGAVYSFALDVLYHESFLLEAGNRFSSVFFVSVLMIGVWHLIYYIIKFIQRNRNLLIDQLQMENNVKSLQIKSIKNNLQPHFIFNALNSIRALVDEDPSRARSSITQLSNILRSSIMADKVETVPLNKELEIVRDYLSLEGIRYEERLQCEYNIASDTLELPVPPLMLQTLCENAVKHGISATSGGGRIVLTSKIDKDKHLLCIRNTGQFNPERILPSHLSSGFGLDSTKQRLTFVFGTEATMQISNVTSSEVELVISIPLQQQKSIQQQNTLQPLAS